jgi:hypothetical protein
MSKKDKINKASEDLLNGLHQMVAQDLINRIQSGEASIQEVNAAIKFLKDNDVTADITFNKPLAALEGQVATVGELPFISEEEEDESDEETD